MTLPEMKISDARSHLADIVRAADLRDEPTVITQNGRPAAVVIGIDEYRQFAEARDAQLIARIRERAATSEYVDHDEVLREAGIQ